MKIAFLLALGILAGGCADLPREAGIGDVERILADRSAPRIHWNQGTAADAEVAARVRSLLSATLTAETAVEIAILNNRRLQATYEDLSVAQAELVQAGLLRNPSIDAEIRFGLDGGTGAHLGFEQSFMSLFLIPVRKRIAGAAFEATKLRVAGAVIDHAAETRAAFHIAQAARQTVELRATVVGAVEASYDLAKRIHQAGNITDLDLDMERVQLEDAKLDLASAEIEWALARARLDALLGVSGAATAWRVGPRLLDPPDAEEDVSNLERRAIERSLELGVIRQRILAAGERIGLDRARVLFPDLDAGVEAEREPEGSWTVGPGLSIPLPIFDQGQAAVAEAEARLRQLRETRTALAVELRAAVRAGRTRVVAARERVDYLRRVILPLRGRIVEETQLQYNAMQVGGFQLLEARRRQVEAGARYVRELREYWVARSELGRTIAGRMPRDGTGSRGDEGGSEAVSEGEEGDHR